MFYFLRGALVSKCATKIVVKNCNMSDVGRLKTEVEKEKRLT